MTPIEKDLTKEIIKISVPLTLGKIIGSITYFFEPIIVTNLMLKYGNSMSFITLEYGLLNGYALPILLLPGFFSLSFSNYMLPKLSSSIGNTLGWKYLSYISLKDKSASTSP